MSTTRACLACRTRKVRCVPGPHRCVRCEKMDIKICVYVKKKGIGKVLRMGEACKSCRVKKKKCDAKRPCTTCVLSRDASECVYYDDEEHPQSAGESPSRSTDDRLPGQQPRDANTAKVPIPDSPDESNSTPSASDDMGVAAHEPPVLPEVEVDQVPRGRPSGLVLVRRNTSKQRVSPGTNPPISIVSSFPSPTIPPEPRIPLSFLGGERLQVQFPERDVIDLDMRSRLWLLVRLLKFGIQFSSKKMDALLRGDLSGNMLDRSFVCGSHVFGMMFTVGTDDIPAMVGFHARRVQTAWESLAELFKGNDHRTKVHSAVLVASSHIYMCMPQMALLYIQKSCDFIRAGDLQFVPTCGRPPEFSENLHETLTALSQTIYWANYLFLMRGGPEPRATAGLEREFRQELPQAYPILFKICPLTMRTQGILLVRDAILLIGVIPADGVKPGPWRQTWDHILTPLDKLSQSLLHSMKLFRDDENGVNVIGSSCIACLAHLAILCEVVSRVDPAAEVEMCNLCDSALKGLGTLTSQLHFDEYTYLDLLLADSWKKSLPVFDVRIGNLPPEESGSLRHFRELVREVYADFQTRLPDCEPPMIYSLAMSEDGITEDSKYPSLMSAQVRTLYGI